MTKQLLSEIKRVCGRVFSKNDIPAFIRRRDRIAGMEERETLKDVAERQQAEAAEEDDYNYQKEREEALIK